MKNLVLDIETSPNLAFVWDLWHGPVQPSNVILAQDIMCFAAKWLEHPEKQDEVIYFEQHDPVEKMEMLRQVWQLLDETDVIVTKNGKKFDKRRIDTQLAVLEYQPYTPFKHVDLEDTVARRMDFPSHSLEFVARQFGLGGKIKHPGIEMWMGCLLQNDQAMWDKMREYCIGDIELTARLYYRVRPWIERHPSHAIFNDKECCTNCGSEHIIKNGFARTQTRTYQRYRCAECGHSLRGTRSIGSIAITEAVS